MHDDWPVGFHQGGTLTDFWKLEAHKLGETNVTHFADATGHKNRMQGNECVACHKPKIEQTIADVNVRRHTFKFVSPTMTDEFKIPNPCTSCHTDKTTDWAREALRGWPGVSPWRLE